MDSFGGALAAALWFGILTAISPCPLATNITAVSYIARRFDSTGKVVRLGAWYALGRLLAYVSLGMILVSGMLSVPMLSNMLQYYGHQLLGPVLIVTGMVLLGLIRFGSIGFLDEHRMRKLAERGDLAGAGALGFVFALAFCPVSAALFFGTLIPLASGYRSAVVIPVMYGLGTVLPVLLTALVLSQGSRMIGAHFRRVVQFECWARRITGVIFILTGMYLSVTAVFLSS